MKIAITIIAIAGAFLFFNTLNAKETKEEEKARLVAELLKTHEENEKIKAENKELDKTIEAYKKLNKTAEKLVNTFETKQ